jgi:uncharacterized protein YciI
MIRAFLFLLFAFISLSASSQDFYIVFLNKNDDKAVLPEAEVNKLMEGHMANISRLAKEGKLWAAGPFEGGGGLFIFKTPSRDSVTRWIMTDPAVSARRWNVEVFSYQPRVGSVCAVDETSEMTNYWFVRYTENSRGASGVNTLEHLKPWLTRGAIIAEGGLGDENGSLLVMKEEPTAALLAAHPFVKSGALSAQLRKLYIARGSFCEPK